MVFLLHTSVHAADEVRISIAQLSGQFMTMSLAHKGGAARVMEQIAEKSQLR